MEKMIELRILRTMLYLMGVLCDWLFPLIRTASRAAFVTKFVLKLFSTRIASDLEVGHIRA